MKETEINAPLRDTLERMGVVIISDIKPGDDRYAKWYGGNDSQGKYHVGAQMQGKDLFTSETLLSELERLRNIDSKMGLKNVDYGVHLSLASQKPDGSPYSLDESRPEVFIIVSPNRGQLISNFLHH